MPRHRLSANARSEAPLAVEYRRSRAAYRRAGRALRKSCSTKKRVCGFSRRRSGGRTFAFTEKNVKAMLDHFLSAPAGSGTNEDVIRAQLGHLDVRDPVQWEAVAERYEPKKRPARIEEARTHAEEGARFYGEGVPF